MLFFFHSLKYSCIYSCTYNLCKKNIYFSVFGRLSTILHDYLFAMPLYHLLSLFLTCLFPSRMNSLNYSCEFKSDCRIDFWAHRETHGLPHTLTLFMLTLSLSLIHTYYLILRLNSRNTVALTKANGKIVFSLNGLFI